MPFWTALGVDLVPPLHEMAEDPQFEPVEITKAEFEEVWKKVKKCAFWFIPPRF